jgi:large repetitive protein
VLASQASAGAMTTVTLYVSTSGTKTTGCTGAGVTACKTIQEGVTAAEKYTGDAVTLTVAAGTFTGGITIAASKLASLTVEGAGAPTTKVTGHGSTGDFTVSSGTLTVERLSIDGGSSTTGGGVFNDAAALTLSDDTFSGDAATSRGGGGVFNNGYTVTMTDDTFSGDHAADGAGFGAGGGVYNQGTATLTGDTFSGDKAGTRGGGLLNYGTSYLTDDTFSGDSTQLGGGIYNAGGTTVTDGTFLGDSAQLGGGVLNSGTANATLMGDTFTDDTASANGGGVYNYGTATVRDDTFSGDDAAFTGGGVLNYATATATLTDDTFSGDHAADDGGGVYNGLTGGLYLRSATATLTDDTFSGDSANAGGGVYNVQGIAILTASILNTSSCFLAFSGNYNVTTTTTCKIGSTSKRVTTLDLTATLKPNTSTGPETLAIGPTSPAIDEVPKSTCTVTTDERGEPRPGITGQTSCDAGAYELQHTPGTLNQGSPKKGSVTHGTTATFQLAVRNHPATTGKVSFEATGSVPTGVTVSPTGKITVSATTAQGTYTLTGTDTDPLHDAGTWTFALHVGQAPAIKSTQLTFFTVGKHSTFTVTTIGTPPVELTETGTLPTGITFKTRKDGTATISGTPAATTGGVYSLTFTASNHFGKDTRSFILVVDQAPAFTSKAKATFTAGVTNTFTVTTSGYPAPSITESGTLPYGVTFTTEGNGTTSISGKPTTKTRARKYKVKLTASNGLGKATQTFTLKVR